VDIALFNEEEGNKIIRRFGYKDFKTRLFWEIFCGLSVS